MKAPFRKVMRRLFTRQGRAAVRALQASRTRAQRRQAQAGFNLIEIMVAIAIIGVLMAIVGINVIGALDSAKIDASKTSMGNVKSALLMYKLDNGRFPSTSEGLNALVQAPAGSKKPGKKYLDSMPKDGWDNEFMYFSPGTRGNNEYEIISYGSDGQDGGQDSAADINSWELTK